MAPPPDSLWLPYPPTRVHVRFDARGELAEFWLRHPGSEELARRGLRALALAPTLEVCRALLADEHVPLSALDPKWVERFYLRS